MNALAGRAYGQARARARRAAILSEPAVIAMAGVPALTQIAGWRDLGRTDDGSATLAVVFSRLIADHVVMRRAYPEARAALAALLQLHELENLKLLWRAAVRGTAGAEWRGSWRPLGVLQTIRLDSFAGPLTLAALTATLQATRYRELAEATRQSHGQDVAAAELAIDRFGTAALVSAHDRLPRRERSARKLLRAIIDHRNARLEQRASTMVGRPDQSRLASRTPITALARRLLAREPFSLAVPLALILLRDEEGRRLVTLSEVRARHLSAVAARRAMEAASRGQ